MKNNTKQIISFLMAMILLSLLLLVVCSCEGEEETTIEPPVKNDPAQIIFDTGFDPDKDPLPSFEELQKITEGMRVNEVYAIAGAPQRTTERMIPTGFGAALSVPCYTYDTKEGGVVFLSYKLSEDQTELIVDYIEYIYPGEEETTTGPSVEHHPFDVLVQMELEPDKEPLPSFEELQTITEGMTFSEAYAIAGAPQRTESRVIPHYPSSSAASPRLCYVYDTQQGISVAISYCLWDGASELTVYYVDYIFPTENEPNT